MFDEWMVSLHIFYALGSRETFGRGALQKIRFPYHLSARENGLLPLRYVKIMMWK